MSKNKKLSRERIQRKLRIVRAGLGALDEVQYYVLSDAESKTRLTYFKRGIEWTLSKLNDIA
jgi:hypothetical protein